MATLCQYKERLIRNSSYISDFMNCSDYIVLLTESHSTLIYQGQTELPDRL